MSNYGTRILVFEPAPRLRKPEKYLAAMADWAKGFQGWYPEDNEETRHRGHIHWHAPCDRRLMDPPWAKPEHQRAALQTMLDVAASLKAARPRELDWQRIYTVIPWPGAWGSEVGIFTDFDYGRDFEKRNHPVQTWTPLDPKKRSLAREIGLKIPKGFVEAGYQERCEEEEEEEDEDAPDGLYVFEQEIWMIREPVPE